MNSGFQLGSIMGSSGRRLGIGKRLEAGVLIGLVLTLYGCPWLSLPLNQVF